MSAKAGEGIVNFDGVARTAHWSATDPVRPQG